MKNFNQNKTVSASSTGMIISYTDSRKHYKLHYTPVNSALTQLQISGNPSHQHIGTTVNSLTQQKLYRLALYGLSVYTPEEIARLSFIEKKKIIVTQQKTQTLLNKFKQEAVHKKIGSFLTTFFPKSSFAKALAHYDKYLDDTDKNTMSFKDLGITKEMIIDKLLSAGLLPKNFYQLK